MKLRQKVAIRQSTETLAVPLTVRRATKPKTSITNIMSASKFRNPIVNYKSTY